MKKQLLLLTLGLAGLFSAQAAEEHYLPRTSWTVTPCSWINDIAPSGPVSCMIDDNLETYWHSNWSSDATDGYHWFTIDLGSEQTIDGFDYWRRQGSGNGNFKAGKVYVSNTAFSFSNHDAAKTYAENAENVPVGDFTFTYDADADGKRRCAFSSPVTGRYVLVYISEVTVSPSGTKDACCAEFKIYSTAEVTQEAVIAMYNEGIAAKKTMAENLSVLKAAVGGVAVPDVAAPADLTAANLDAKISEANTSLQNYINLYNDKQVSIKAGIRRQNSPYLAAVLTGTGVKFNTIPAVTPDAVWSIIVKDNGINLYNRNTGYYIGTNNGAQGAGSAQLLVPGVILDSYVKFAKGATNQLLNIDSNSSDLTDWHVADDSGSCWAVEAADYDYAEPQLSTDTEQHYYRIVSARWMAQHASPSMAVNGENQAGNGIGERNSRALASIPGVYWRIEDAGDGAVKLVNLTGYKMSNNNGIMTEEGSPLYLVKQTDAQFKGKTCYGITKSSDASAYEYYDAVANSGNGVFCWTPTTDGVGNGNNGSLWYFIMATDAEIETATAAYLTGVKSHTSMPKLDAELAALMGEEFMQSINENYFTDDNFLTIADANAAKVAGPDKVAAIKTAVEGAVGSKLTAGYMIKNRNSSYTNCFLTAGLNTPEEGEPCYQTTPTAATNDLNAIWSFEQKDGGYIIRSANSGMALARIDEMSKPILLTQEGLTYTIGYNPIVPGFNFTLMPQTESDTDMHYFALHQGSNTLVCKWEAQNVAGSHWSINPLNEATVEVKQGEGEGAGHVITLGEGVTVNDHATAAELVLTITKKAGTDASESEVVTAAVEPVDGVYTIKASEFIDNNNLSNLAEGEYELVAPAGYFLVNGASAGAVNYSFSVAQDGSTTGVDEISVAAPAVDVIYDLQGRRVSKASKGLYIINGKKVLVK